MALDAAIGVCLEGVQVVSQGASEEHRLLEDGRMDPQAPPDENFSKNKCGKRCKSANLMVKPMVKPMVNHK